LAKSVNEYYSEKMKKLLEMQKESSAPSLSAPGAASKDDRSAPSGKGRGYYERFRSDAAKGQREKQGTSPQPQRPQGKVKNPLEKTAVDDLREGRAPRKRPMHSERPAGENKGQPRPREPQNPEQTARDKYQQSLRQIEAMQTARRARMMRTVRDAVISFGLTFAVLVVFLVVVYRLLFIITDVTAVGGVANTPEELLAASGVTKGDHLFSFSSKDIGTLMTLRCPEVESVDVERTPPGKIVFNVVEEEPVFYADFYGEYRLLSPTLRVMDSVAADDAVSTGMIKLKLPDVKRVTAGLTPEFSRLRDDSYIYSVCREIEESELWGRVGSVSLIDKFDLSLTVDGKYIVRLGDSESIEMKLKIAAAVLKDEMFSKDIKATIDVTDLSESSVVVDEGLLID